MFLRQKTKRSSKKDSSLITVILLYGITSLVNICARFTSNQICLLCRVFGNVTAVVNKIKGS